MSIEAMAKGLLAAIGENNENQGVTDFISTGFPPLNKIISGSYDGGLPQGRMVEMYGPSSSGKCQPEETMVLSEHGLTTFGELFRLEGFESYCVSKNIEHKVKMVNELGEFEETSHFVWSGKRKTVRLATNLGMVTEATLHHPLRVMNEHGHIVWRRAEDIQIGDYLVAARGTNKFGKEELSLDEAKLIGYLIADGSMNDGKRTSFSNSDVEVIADFKRIMSDGFGVSPVTRSKGGVSKTQDHFIDETALRTLLKNRYGLDITKSAGKEVPICVRLATRGTQIQFIRSYFELESHISSKYGDIEVISASKKLLAQVQLMLLNLGIISKISTKTVKDYPNNEYWRLTIGVHESAKYFEIVGYETSARKDVIKTIAPAERNSTDAIPHQLGFLRSLFDGSSTNREIGDVFGNYLSGKNKLGYAALAEILMAVEGRFGECKFTKSIYGHLKNLLDANYYYDRVELIEADFKPVFDVSLPRTHSFVANGFISHNTALATAMLIQAQKAGGIAGFMDHEKSFAIEMARNMGLRDSFPHWIYKQPPTWEQSNTMMAKAAQAIRQSKAIPDKAPILFVFDSIASALPKSMVDKDFDEYNMNDTTALARVTSTTLKSMAMFTERYNFTVLYLNQIRTKPGVVYGPATTTPGGGSTEFYATVRIELSRKKIMEERAGEKVFVGQEINMKTTKNKLTRPFQEISWRMGFREDGSGYFDVTSSMIDVLLAKGKLTKAGHRIVWTDGKQYFQKALVQHIDTNGLQAELNKLLGD